MNLYVVVLLISPLSRLVDLLSLLSLSICSSFFITVSHSFFQCAQYVIHPSIVNVAAYSSNLKLSIQFKSSRLSCKLLRITVNTTRDLVALKAPRAGTQFEVRNTREICHLSVCGMHRDVSSKNGPD